MASAARLNTGTGPLTIQHPFGDLRGSHAQDNRARNPPEDHGIPRAGEQGCQAGECHQRESCDHQEDRDEEVRANGQKGADQHNAPGDDKMVQEGGDHRHGAEHPDNGADRVGRLGREYEALGIYAHLGRLLSKTLVHGLFCAKKPQYAARRH